jgi:Na+/H+ antiporter NhaD/arsenite permease-like protein
LLLLVYYVWDSWRHAREPLRRIRTDRAEIRPLRLRGRENLALLAGIIACAALLSAPWRELGMIALAAASMTRTPATLRRANHFSFHPILEVAAVFAGIFATMMPALDLLRANGAALGVREPWQYFWATGMLSSLLDNAPTYLTFLALGQGQGLANEVVGVPHEILTAISLGAVFMGANTYIGNGPNFMVRSIAESRGVAMPSFGGYMLYSVGILIPVFVGVSLVFF